ncbi:MAG: FAD-dependent oxidoreductase [Alphaproteobacteria bacterium]|nr:FAD-dependent oxidoreductase [Alphaproteobacteria bacterium]
MTRDVSCDLCVIGAGSGGLSVAAGAAQMGADVVLIERAEMGGECLNTGCVPSKALLAAAHAAQDARRADRFGVHAGTVSIDGAEVFRRVHETVAAIAPHDSQDRFEGLGVRVIRAAARFTGPDTVVAGDWTVRAKRFVVATGSRPAVPAVPGLDAADVLTNETVFKLTDIPGHLIVIGGGPVGCEMAQAFRGLGAKVTVLELGTILSRDDPQLVRVVRNRLLEDGVALHEGVRVDAARKTSGGVEIDARDEDGRVHAVRGTHVLAAAGRSPNLDGLGLEHARIDYGPGGIDVDARMRTTNRRAFAIGDVAAGQPRFTHAAGHHAGIVIRNVLFKWPARADRAVMPWVTYTRPELAQAGLTEAQARQRFGDAIRVLTAEFRDNDRALAERDTEGMIKVIVGNRGNILGAGIAGPRAGELIQPWVLALENGLKIGAMASTIAPYPSLSEINKRAAGGFFTPKLFSERTRRIVRFLMKFT